VSAELDRAREDLAVAEYRSASAAALVAIAAALEANLAETYAAGVTAGATATTEAIATLMEVVLP
jgi:hypothetical protein